MTLFEWFFLIACLIFAAFHLVVGYLYRDYLSAASAEDSYWKKLDGLAIDHPVAAMTIRTVIVIGLLFVLVFSAYQIV